MLLELCLKLLQVVVLDQDTVAFGADGQLAQNRVGGDELCQFAVLRVEGIALIGYFVLQQGVAVLQQRLEELLPQRRQFVGDELPEDFDLALHVDFRMTVGKKREGRGLKAVP